MSLLEKLGVLNILKELHKWKTGKNAENIRYIVLTDKDYDTILKFKDLFVSPGDTSKYHYCGDCRLIPERELFDARKS